MKAGTSVVYLEGPFILQAVDGALKFPIHIEEIAGIQLEFSQTQPFGAKADATDKQDVVGSWHVALFLIHLYADNAYSELRVCDCQGKSFRDRLARMTQGKTVHGKTGRRVSYPLSFRVPLSQVEEIDEAVVREQRKRRSDLLEAIWEVAWANYQRSGSLQSYAEGRGALKRTNRGSA